MSGRRHLHDGAGPGSDVSSLGPGLGGCCAAPRARRRPRARQREVQIPASAAAVLFILGRAVGLCRAEEEVCFANGEDMAFCCSRGEACFEGSDRYGGRGHKECCGPDAIERMLFTARAVLLSPLSSVDDIAGTAETMKSLLLALDAEQAEAWEILVQSLGRKALLRYDVIAERGGAEADVLDLARELNYAAHLSERFFQVLWYDRARRTSRAAFEVDVEEVRPNFKYTLRVYQTLHEALDLIAYSPHFLPAPPPPTAPLPSPTGAVAEEVVLVVAVVGAWADVAMTTFWSILRRRSTALRVFVFGDDKGLKDWQRALAEAARGESPAALDGVRVELVDIFRHEGFAAYLRRLPPGRCASTRMGVALFARLVCHELLPPDVRRAIAMDLGDILVLEDILGLWREGELLAPGELLAAASHRSQEEASRTGKPSMLNGGVVLYNVERMRRANYTEDTIRAAYRGVERNYSRFCDWDQDIINVMHEDLWGHSRVRVLPCRWSLFPVTGWQFSWNTPSHWLPEIFSFRRYPGLLAAGRIEHFCPDEMQLLPNVMAFDTAFHKQVARDVAIIEGTRNRFPDASIRSPDGSLCACGEAAALLHVPSTMKLWPWAQRLFEFHRPHSLRPVAAGAFFTSREEMTSHEGASVKKSGFWGGEDEADVAVYGRAAIEFAKEMGLSVADGRCMTLPVLDESYVRVDFVTPIRSDNAILELVVETTAESDACIFLGNLDPPLPGAAGLLSMRHVGVEIVLGAKGNTRSSVHWGYRGKELASHDGAVLRRGAAPGIFSCGFLLGRGGAVRRVPRRGLT